MHLRRTTISALVLRSLSALSLSAVLAASSLAQTPSPALTCLDVDGNSVVDDSDVLLIIRYFLGFSDAALTDGALGTNPGRSSPSDIVAFIQGRSYDIDGNTTTQLSDLILIKRYVSGVNGTALTSNALGEGARRTTETDIVGYINSGCSAAPQNVSQATAKSTVRLASSAVLTDLVEIKLQHGGAGQVVVRGDKRADPTMSVGGLTLIQPINNPMSTVAVHIDTTLLENDHTVFGVRTAKLEDVFTSINVNTSAVLSEGQIVAKRALSGVTFKAQDNFGNIAELPTVGDSRSNRIEQSKAGVWFPRDDDGGGFNIDPQAINTAAPPGAVGFSKLLIEIKDGVVWDSDGDITSPNQGPQLILNGKIGFEDVRVTTVIDWPSVTAKPKKIGAKVNGTLIVDTNLKLTGGSLVFTAADFFGLDDQDVAKNELDLGYAKIKGVKYEDGRINIGSVAWNMTTNGITAAGFNETVFIPIGVVITFYLGLDGNISASAEFGYAYSAYVEKGGEYNFVNDVFTPYDVFAAGSFPNPNKPGATPATPADFATRPTPTYTAKMAGAATVTAALGIEAGVAVLGFVPLAVDNRVKIEGNVTASLGAASQDGWFGCITGTFQPTFDSRFKVNAVLAAKDTWKWFNNTFNLGYSFEKTLGSWSPPVFNLGGSAGDCAVSITADFGHAVVGTGTTAGTLLTQLTAQASTSSGSIPPAGFAWYLNEKRLTDSNGAIVTSSSLTTPLTPGNYDVKLIVTDSANRKKEVRKAIKVAAMLPVSPTTTASATPQAVYGWYPKDVKANQVIRFDPSSSKVIDSLTTTSAITEYRWNFGDGTASVITTSPTVQQKTFVAPGGYNVSLTVTAANSQTSTYTRSIWVGTQPLVTSAASNSLRLNDTGITFCATMSSGNAQSPCISNPNGQDKDYGRDARAIAGALAKVGGSANVNGFDFSKISNNGSVLPATAALGSGPDDWACTRDNVTGLIWEVKTASGLRSQSHTYTWYKTGSPDGNNGMPAATTGTATCHTLGRCDTEKYNFDVNATTLCGFTDWRMPSVHELFNLTDLGRPAFSAIDPIYFPNTPGVDVWSGSPFAVDSFYAWYVNFAAGIANGFDGKVSTNGARLVRGGQ
jgi:PKD repeat protein